MPASESGSGPVRVAHARGAGRARSASSRPRSPSCAAGSPRRPVHSPRPRAAARRHPALAGRGHRPERAARPDPARGPRPDHDAQGGGRPARPAAGRLRHLPRRATRTTPSTCSPAAASCGSTSARRSTSTTLQRGQEVMLNEALNVVAALEFEQVGEVVMLKELLADGDRALVIANADEERVVRLAEPLRDEHAARRRLAAARRPRPATSTRRSRSPRSRSWSSRRSRTSTTSDIGGLVAPDRADPRRRRAALPAPRAVHRARAQAAEGRAALRPARLRQDADRQGGRELAGQEGRGQDRPGGEVATSSTSRAPSCSTSTSARPSGTSGWCSSGPARRPARAPRSSCSSTRWTRCSAPAARASPPTSRTPSSRSCSARSTASRRWRTSWSSAPPTART